MLRFCLYFIFFILIFFNQAFAFDLDETVDDDIRKNYNSSKLIKDTNTDELETLPDLPEKLKNENLQNKSDIKSATKINNISQQPDKPPLKTIHAGNIKIPKGTSFTVVNSSNISDWLKTGSNVKFKIKNAQQNKNYIIPASTVFAGEVTESHQPQITCNGGLVAIKIHSMTYNGNTIPINAYITQANGKHIFFNDIKGNRTYLKTMWKKGNWGRNIFNKMCNLTVKLGSDGSTLLLSPFPFAYGTICLGLNTITSPICAFFNKGGHVSIPAGSNFKIKLREDAFID